MTLRTVQSARNVARAFATPDANQESAILTFYASYGPSSSHLDFSGSGAHGMFSGRRAGQVATS
jgi:hypothetical protein